MDIELTETLDGGDMILVEIQDETGVYHDLQLDGGLTTAVYLSHFGGNVEASTTGNESPGELRNDFWGNALLSNDPDAQANSSLERSLFELPITSGNLLKIEDQALSDLKWMINQGIASDVTVEALTLGPEIVRIIDLIVESALNTDFKTFWDFDKKRALMEV